MEIVHFHEIFINRQKYLHNLFNPKERKFLIVIRNENSKSEYCESKNIRVVLFSGKFACITRRNNKTFANT